MKVNETHGIISLAILSVDHEGCRGGVLLKGQNSFLGPQNYNLTIKNGKTGRKNRKLSRTVELKTFPFK